jgi:hypothetical protein
MSTFKLRRRHQRPAAAIGGLLFLFGQLLGAVHSHRYQCEQSLSANGQASASASGPCAICLTTLHTPGAVGSAPAVVRRQSIVEGTVEPRTRPCSARALARPHGRAPPASV